MDLRNAYDLSLVGFCENMGMLQMAMRYVAETCQTRLPGFWIPRLASETLD